MGSIWSETAEMPQFAPLDGDLKTDVLIVGGGMAGLLCAFRLQQAGVDYALVEAKRLCSGATANTTAKITAQHGLIYQKLLQMLGEERAGQYLRANLRAVEEYGELCRTIPCDFERQDSFVYAKDKSDALKREIGALQRLGYKADFVEKPSLPFSTAGAVRFRDQAQFHPLKFAAGIARGLRIFEQTKVQELGPHTARTDRGLIHAKTIFVTTHFPILNKHGGYFLKLFQERAYALALKGAPEPEGMYVDASQTGLSFRGWGDYLILTGPSRRTGKKSGGWRELETLAKRFYPGCQTAFRWANQDCMTLDGSSYIGAYAKGTEGLYTATGFHQWGMTSSMAAADLLTDAVLGRRHPSASAFDPSRSILHPQLAVNAVEAVLHLLTPTVPRCPHMGCALRYNREERTWDCPCHGSRFAEDGELLNNPATDDRKG